MKRKIDQNQQNVKRLVEHAKKSHAWRTAADRQIRGLSKHMIDFQRNLNSFKCAYEKKRSMAISFPTHIKEDDEQSRAQQIIAQILRTLHIHKEQGLSPIVTNMIYDRLDDLWTNGLEHAECGCGDCVLCCNNTWDDTPAAPISMTIGTNPPAKRAKKRKFPKQPT